MKLFSRIQLLTTIVAAATPFFLYPRNTTDHLSDLTNPYTASMVAGMLPAQDMQQKIKILEGVSGQINSLSTQLSLLETYFEAGEHKKIVLLLNKTKGLKDYMLNHPRTGLVVVKSFVKLGMDNEAMDLIIRLNTQHPTDQEIAFLTALFYEQKNEITNALKVADSYLNKSMKKQSNFAFLFLKTRLYTKIGDSKNALASIEQALKIQPTFEMGWLMFAQMKENKGELEDAVKGYVNYLDNTVGKPSNAATQTLTRSIEGKLLKMMFDLTVKKHTNPERSHIERCRNQVIQLFQQKKYKDVLQVLDNCLAGKECGEEARLMKIQALGAMQDYEEAARLLTAWIIEDPEKTVWFEALHLLYFAGLDSHKIIDALLAVDKKCPKNLFVSLYLADLYTRVADFTQAIVHHRKALALTDETDLQTSIYFQMGLAYYELGQHKEMASALEAGKELGHDYAPLLNLLAYHYITKGNNLGEAEKIMQTVLADSPNNPHYLDTQAMLLRKQGKHQEALTIFETIAKQEPYDATIARHMAKACKALGKNKEAVAHLEAAVKLTYETQKKQKYEQLLAQWKTDDTHGTKKDSNVLCRR